MEIHSIYNRIKPYPEYLTSKTMLNLIMKSISKAAAAVNTSTAAIETGEGSNPILKANSAILYHRIF